MGAKRVASDFKAREKLRRENSLALARELIDNVLWNCEHNPRELQAMTIEQWRDVFERLREILPK